MLTGHCKALNRNAKKRKTKSEKKCVNWATCLHTPARCGMFHGCYATECEHDVCVCALGAQARLAGNKTTAVSRLASRTTLYARTSDSH
eukprot:5503381-Prymnesium_polylepis.1